jgi:hypothetical protein
MIVTQTEIDARMGSWVMLDIHILSQIIIQIRLLNMLYEPVTLTAISAELPSQTSCLADQIRLCAKSGDLRIKYIIFDGRIASPKRRWAWRKYTGSNSHKSHLHISFTSKGDFDGSFFNIPMIGGE